MGSNLDVPSIATTTGRNIAMNGTGDIVVVTSWPMALNRTDAGYAKSFKWNGSSWVSHNTDTNGGTGYLTSGPIEDYYGKSVAMNDAGDKFIIGVHEFSNDIGRVKIYEADVINTSNLETTTVTEISTRPLTSTTTSTNVLTSPGETTVTVKGKSQSSNTTVNIEGEMNINQVVSVKENISINGATIQGSGFAILSATTDWQSISSGSNQSFQGRTHAFSKNGARIALGYPYNNNYTGEVRILEYSGANSVWHSKGTISGINNYGYFGFSVSLNKTGDIVAISAVRDDESAGIVRVYSKNSNDTWTQLGSDIVGPYEKSGQYLTGALSGWSVSLSADGTILAISAPWVDVLPATSRLTDEGNVKVYEYSNSNWSQLGTSLTGSSSGDNLGKDIQLSDDGRYLAVGAPHVSSGGSNNGSSSVYQWSNGSWGLIPGGQIIGENGSESGTSIAMNADGNKIIVGCPKYDHINNDSGLVRVYERVSGSWKQLGNDLIGTGYNQRFGCSVAISQIGTTIAVASESSSPLKTYTWNGTTWAPLSSTNITQSGTITITADAHNKLFLGVSSARDYTSGPSSNDNTNVYKLNYTESSRVERVTIQNLVTDKITPFNDNDLTFDCDINCSGELQATAFTATSDYRIKEDVVSISDTSFNIDNIRPIYYNNNKTQKPDFGVIAHETQEVFPFLVKGEKDGEELQSVNYTGFIGLLINEIQQLKKQHIDMSARFVELENKNTELETQISNITNK